MWEKIIIKFSIILKCVNFFDQTSFFQLDGFMAMADDLSQKQFFSISPTCNYLFLFHGRIIVTKKEKVW